MSRCKLTERTSIDLLKLIGSVPDPFRAIELAKSQLQEQGSQYEQIERLRSENTKLKERLTRRERNESSESGGDSSKSELVYHLSEQVGRTTQLNLELTSKLKLAEGEIDSYKRILAEYQNEISDMKVKHLNEASYNPLIIHVGNKTAINTSLFLFKINRLKVNTTKIVIEIQDQKSTQCKCIISVIFIYLCTCLLKVRNERKSNDLDLCYSWQSSDTNSLTYL